MQCNVLFHSFFDIYVCSNFLNCGTKVTFVLSTSFTGPLYLYYELTNFYQNHRRYILSKSIGQLQGQNLAQSAVELDCNPLYLNGSNLLNPCGLIANSFFNGTNLLHIFEGLDAYAVHTFYMYFCLYVHVDEFALISAASNPSTLTLDETNIALPTDKASLYAQVSGFKYVAASCSASGMVNSSTCVNYGLSAGCKCYVDTSTMQSYYFYYPNDDSTQYLYETYPNQISPIDGVTDEHFMVWMRTSSLPTFRKLYGKISGE